MYPRTNGCGLRATGSGVGEPQETTSAMSVTTPTNAVTPNLILFIIIASPPENPRLNLKVELIFINY